NGKKDLTSISASLTSNAPSLISNLSAQSFAIIPIDTSHSLIDPPSPLSSTSLLSPVVVSIDANRSSVSPSSQPTSPSISATTSSRSADISRSSFDPLSQPILPSYKINQENRSFQKQWFNNRPWLEYSIAHDRVYCYYCRHFGSTNNLINRNQSDAFIIGYNNWKHALGKNRRFQLHETSTAHIQATSNHNQFRIREKSKETIINIMDKGRLEQIRKNRERLIKSSSVIHLCCRQMISLRGHEEHQQKGLRSSIL
ncbi:unnamed protein product, partial [Rotaria sp. Silwood2]